jgi:hypothetical protein
MSLTLAHHCLYIDPTNSYNAGKIADLAFLDGTLSDFVERQCSVDQ